MTAKPRIFPSLAVGVILCAGYAGVARLTVSTGALHGVRPMYEGPCPPSLCPPCPPDCITPPPYSQAPPIATPIPPVPPSATTIDPEGGTAASSDNEVSISVPTGALSLPCKFHFTVVTKNLPANPPGRQPATRVWDISAIDGAGDLITVFNKPIDVTFHYPARSGDLVAYWDGEEWVNLDSTANSSARLTAAVTPHLSLVAAFTGVAPPGPGPSFPVAAAVIALVAVAAIAVVTVASRRRTPKTGGPTP